MIEWSVLLRCFSFKYPDNDKPTRAEEYEMCGPKTVFMRMTQEERDLERQQLRTQGFDFAARFPRIASVLNRDDNKNLYFKVFQRSLLIAKEAKKSMTIFLSLVFV
jgi:hypothetical protein